MASEKRGLYISASLKFVFRENGFKFPFRKNDNGMYPTSSALELQFENQWSFKKFYIIQGGTFKFKQSKSTYTESEFVFAQREASPRHD